MNRGQHKEKRLHEGGVGPEMRSPAGLAELRACEKIRLWERACPRNMNVIM